MKEIDSSIKNSLLQDIDLPNTYKYMIRETLKNKNKLKTIDIKNRIYRMVVSIISMILGLTGICFAGVSLYNNLNEDLIYQNNIETRGLFDDESGITNVTTDFRMADMIRDDENDSFYKVITNYEKYMEYKNRVSDLPNMTEDDFKENALFIMTWMSERQLHEKDLKVEKVTCDSETTYIILNQNDNPNYDDESNVLFAIINKEKLRDSIKIQYDYSELENLMNLDDSTRNSNTYLVIENNEVKSGNIDILDKFLSESTRGKQLYIRVSDYQNDEIIEMKTIYDVLFKNGVYYVIRRNEEGLYKTLESYAELIKIEGKSQILYFWKEHKDDESYIPFIMVNK